MIDTRKLRWTLALALALSLPAQAAIEPLRFDNPELERRYKELANELRCLVCQNQNIADSNAELANDLRRQVHEQLLQGRTNQQIRDFMTDRYGDFVLYDPPMNAGTLLLWGGPFVLLLLGGAVLWRLTRRSPAGPAHTAHVLSDADRRRAEALLARPSDPRRPPEP